MARRDTPAETTHPGDLARDGGREGGRKGGREEGRRDEFELPGLPGAVIDGWVVWQEEVREGGGEGGTERRKEEEHMCRMNKLNQSNKRERVVTNREFAGKEGRLLASRCISCGDEGEAHGQEMLLPVLFLLRHDAYYRARHRYSWPGISMAVWRDTLHQGVDSADRGKTQRQEKAGT